MIIDTPLVPRAIHGPSDVRDGDVLPRDVRPGDEFTAVVSGGLEWWRVVAVLGIRVLAERVAGDEHHSFTLRFVRYRLSPDVARRLADEDGVPVRR
ncbi:hypothetical protein [Rathayibacter sp. VKM Ac-2760]|uniref:hypothetical protein n=1 Tax=Rathayibacter sp. VKM Ac-2760 TaxID=2609253 RepID=UPI0013199460|nr:hypothetical protein [Rathayibacter sp. VKM Ac-2760]QHC57780.1 hypothetical protein GSU72_03720 [Rathayibacter sp. VKM Ac-2760]